MTDGMAATDPYTTAFEAAVERIDGRDVTLSETYFYPEGGGQPADEGTLAGIPVTDVQSVGGAVVHTLAEMPDASPGETVTGEIDASFRTYCMRAHTASHVLYGAGRRLLDDLGYGGFDIASDKIRVDLRTSSDVADETLVALERLTNRAVWESRPVTWEHVPREEATERPGVAFNAKTEEGVSDEETVRLVTIGEPSVDVERSETGRTGSAAATAFESGGRWDVAACGGTHVENTREIGPVTVLDRSNPGEGLTRVEFAVGSTARDRRATEKASALDAANALGTAVTDVPVAIERIRSERDDLAAEVAALTDRLVEARIAELREDVIERDGDAWLVGTVDGVDANELADRTRELAGDAADVIALVGSDGGTFLAVGAGEGVDAGDVIDEVTAEFGGGGGGSPEFAQGGGLQCDPEDVVAFLR